MAKRQKRRTKQQIQDDEYARYQRGEITRAKLFRACPWLKGIEHNQQTKKIREELPKGVTCQVINGTTYYYARVGEKKLSKSGKIITVPSYFGTDRAAAEAARDEFNKKRKLRKLTRQMTKGGMKEDAKEMARKVNAFQTLKELIDWYLNLEEVLQLKNYKGLISTSRIVLAFFGEDALIEEIDNDAIRHFRLWRKQGEKKYRNGLDGEGKTKILAPAQASTINRDVQRLQTMFNRAYELEKLTEFNPKIFTQIDELKPLRRLIKDSEYQLMQEKITDQDLLDLITSAWETAMRSDELAQMQVSWIHLDEQVSEVPRQYASYINIPDYVTKTNEARQVPISGTLRKVLERRCKNLEPDELVFTIEWKKHKMRKGWGSSQRIARVFGRWCDKLGIPYGDNLRDASGGWSRDPDEPKHRLGCTFHCFRGTRITKWVERGDSDSIIMQASGHSDMTVYHKYYAKPRKWAIMRLVNGDPGLKKELQQETKDKNGDKKHHKKMTLTL